MQAIPGLVLPAERTIGLGCIPEGRKISYECIVTDSTGVGLTVWLGAAFNCPGQSASVNRINLPHFSFNNSVVSESCGDLNATSVGVSGMNYISNLTLTVTNELNGLSVICSLGGSLDDRIMDIIKIGGKIKQTSPLHAQYLHVNIVFSFSSSSCLFQFYCYIYVFLCCQLDPAY